MTSTLPVKGNALWRYWTEGKGLAKWRGRPHPWTSLRDALLEEGVPSHMVDGLATNIYHAVTGTYPVHTKKKREASMTTERRMAEVLEVRAEGDSRTAELRILSYGVIDKYKTRFMPGVFSRAVEAGSIPAVWSHDPSRPIGMVTNIRDSATEMLGTLTFLPFEDVPDARMAYASMKAGSTPGVSFGFERGTDERNADDSEVRDITQANMVEVSPVLNPAVPRSRVLSVRSTEVIPASVAADLVTRFAAGMIDLSDALLELKNHRTTPSEQDNESDDVDTGDETTEKDDAEDIDEDLDEDLDEGEELPEDMIGPVADEDDALDVLDRAAGKPRTAASNGIYADPGYQQDKKKRYPLGSKDQVIAAWRYINMPKNSKMYSSGSLSKVKGAIKAAAKKYGVNIAENDRANKTKPTSGPDNTKSTGK